MPKKYLVKNKILKGMRYEQEVPLAAYGGAIVKIHPVSDTTLSAIQEAVDYSIDQVLSDLTGAGMTEEEVDALMQEATASRRPDLEKKLRAKRLPPKMIRFMIELCRHGMVPSPDPECLKCHGQKLPNDEICPECDTRNDVDSLRGFSSLEMGAAILGASVGDWKMVEDFFIQKKERSGPESSVPAPN